MKKKDVSHYNLKIDPRSPDAINQTLRDHMERLESLVNLSFDVLNDWSGDRLMTQVEKEAFCSLWEKLGDFRGWPRCHAEPTANNESI